MKASNKHKEQTIASEQYCPTLSEEYQELFRRLTKRLKDTLPMNRARIIGDELRRASEAAEENDLECKKYMAALSVLVDLSLALLQEALSKDSDDLTKLIKPILAAPSEQEKRSINGIQYPEDNFASATNPGGGVTRGGRRAGGMPVPMLHAVSKSGLRRDVGRLLQTAPPRGRCTPQ